MLSNLQNNKEDDYSQFVYHYRIQKVYRAFFGQTVVTQPAFTCSKLTIETL